MLPTLKRISLVFIIILSLAFFGYLVYTGMGAKTKASVSTDVAGNGEIPSSKEGLVASWNFNETNGDIARSEGSCGKQCDGQLVNFAYTGSQDAALGTGWTAKNKLWSTGSLMFDGVNDYVAIGAEGAKKLDILTDATIELWLNYNGSFNENKAFFTRFKDSSNRMLTFISHSGGYGNKFVFENIIGGSFNKLASDEIVSPNTWYHLAFICGSSGMKMFVNGKQQTSTQASTDCFSSIPDSIRTDIGDHSGALFFPGTIDAVRIYSRALSEKEIAVNFQAQNGKKIISPPADNSVVGLWHLDETSGNAFDSSGNGNTGVSGIITTAGKLGSAALNPNIIIKDSPTINLTNKLTMEYWFQPTVDVTSMSTYPMGVFKRNWEVGGYGSHFWNKDGTVNFQWCWVGACDTIPSKTSFKAGIWYHYAATYDGVNARLFINGVEENSKAVGSALASSLGYNLNIGDGQFQGKIDEVRIYSRALSEKEIAANFAAMNGVNVRCGDTQCDPGYICHQPPQPVCPEGVNCSTVLPRPECINPSIFKEKLCGKEVCKAGYECYQPPRQPDIPCEIGKPCPVVDQLPPSCRLITTATPPQSLTATPVPSGTPNASRIIFKVRMPDVSQSVGTVKDVRVLITDKPGTLYDFKVDLQRVQGTDFFIANPIELDIPDGSYIFNIKQAKSLSRSFTAHLSKGKTLDCTQNNPNVDCQSLGKPELAPLYSGDSDGLVDTKTNNGVRANSYNMIDSNDLQKVVAGYGLSPLPPEPNGDFNLDGKIDVQDLGILGKNFGKRGD